jgi:hypothetical protein
MLTFRYLLALVAAVVAVMATAAAVVAAIQSENAVVKSVAAAVVAEKPAKASTPIAVRRYFMNYTWAGDRWVLTKGPGDVPVYALGLGDCPDAIDPANKTFTRLNATIHIDRCSLAMPWAENDVITHYIPMCTYGTDFKPQAVELRLAHHNLTIRAVLVDC